MAASMDDGDGFQADDLYVLLNVDKKATNQEISKAYRRMSKIFHPDRHHDPEKKKQADIFFNKIKNAYEILSDPNKREIYNRYGMEGLNVQGLEIITRTKSPAEIIAELDRLKYEEEQRRLQRTSPAGEIEVRINATNLFGSSADDADYEPDYEDDLTYVEITEIHVSQSVEYPLTPKDTTIIGGTVSTKNGIGSGNFLVGYRRQTSDKGWVQGNLGFGSGMSFGLQGYRQLTKRCYGKISTFLGTDEAMTRQTVGLSFLLSNQFDRCFRGEMALMVAVRPSLRTTIHYDNEKNRAIFSVQVGKNNFAKAVLERSFESHINNMRFEVILGNVGWFFSYGVKMKVSEFSMIHAKLKITNNGGVSLDMGARRGQQSYFFPIQLSEQVLPSSIFYGTFLPTVAYFAVKKLIIDPYVRRKESEDLKKKQERDSDELLQKKKDAEAAVELMQRTVEKSLEYETNRNGLIILKALYGRLATQDGELVDSECIDVKIPLQAQVTESQLIILESNTKSDLPGFYDPCPGQDKSLYIRYTFRNRPHQVTYDDKDPIRLPLQRHVMQDERDESFAHL
ncbi:dnaJ homolog subfamily C member 11-like [Crassostrea virginica]|uniref:DnaJ homolog subfamily C member 11-like n=1 Tax=Crassostrea virginica TaxID=6565 RepID=A0A8B8EDG4_CRAVI|nr:dnaJ homolog subfamily C member 11-like [Crassostrea virginica]